MGKIAFRDQSNMDTYTLVSDSFISNFLPTLNAEQIKVYLYCLHCIDKDCNFNDLANAINIDPDKVNEILKELEDMNLIQIENQMNPATISFLNPGKGKLFKMHDSSEFNDFQNEITKLLPERYFYPFEMNEYYDFITSKKFENIALVAIIKYCMKIKNDNISYKYILKVAEDFAARGFKTLTAVEPIINRYYLKDDDIKVLGTKIGKNFFDADDYLLFDKWTESFNLGEIIQVATDFKVKSFTAIDNILNSLQEHGIRGAENIAAYKESDAERKNIAVSINKKLGLFLSDLENEIKTYIIPWTNMGYTKSGIDKIAQDCFENNGKTLQFLNDKIHFLYESGITTDEDINQYYATIKQDDKKIKELFKISGFNRTISQNDRDMFNVWTHKWGFDFNTLKFVVKKYEGDAYWQTKINKLLSNCKQQNAFKQNEIEKILESSVVNNRTNKKTGKSYDFTTSGNSSAYDKLLKNAS